MKIAKKRQKKQKTQITKKKTKNQNKLTIFKNKKNQHPKTLGVVYLMYTRISLLIECITITI